MQISDLAGNLGGWAFLSMFGAFLAWGQAVPMETQLAVSDAPVWIKTGGPLGGIGYDVRSRADQPDVMYATDTFSGVNISFDGGRTWFASNTGITARSGPSGDAIPIFTLTIDPHDPNIVWAGTQNARGLYRSADGGRTWTEKNRGFIEPFLTIRGITVDPNNRNTVYAAGELSSAQWAGENRLGRRFDMTKGFVYRSVNGGDDWTPIWRGDNMARYVVVDPRNSDVIYVSTGFFDREASNADPQRGSPGGVGVVKSVDGGKTWQVLDQANGLTDLNIGSLVMHPRNPDILLAAAGNDAYENDDPGVFISADGGRTWKRGLMGGHPVRGRFQSVDFAPGDSEIAYAATPQAFLRSEDGGQTWRVVSGEGGSSSDGYGPPGIRTGIPVDIQVDPRNPNRVFVNNYNGGNFLSEDGGRTWQVASKGYTGAQIHIVAVDPGDPDRVFAGGRSGLFRSDDRGDGWLGLNFDPLKAFEFTAIAVHPLQPGVVLAGEEDNGALFRSTDGGRSWELVFQQPGLYGLNFQNRHGFKAVRFAPSNADIVYAGMRYYEQGVIEGRTPSSYGVLKSTDGGRSWRYTNDSNMTGQNVNAIAVHPASAETIYVGTITGGVLVSRDGGASWQSSNSGLPSLEVRSLAIDPANPSVLYASLENNGVYKSLDGGASWRPYNAGIEPQASIRDIVIDPSNPQRVYAAEIRSGVFRSEDGGKLWTRLAHSLSTQAVKSLALSLDGGTLYAATDGEGVFRLDVRAAPASPVHPVSAASYAPGAPVAPDSIAALFGAGFSSQTQLALALPLPTTLGETSVVITDGEGRDFLAPLFYVSPGQVNCLIPSGVKPGSGRVRILLGNQVVSRGPLEIEPVAPGLFSANGDGRGAPAASVVRVSPDGTQTTLPVFECGGPTGGCSPAPINLGSEADRLVLVLFGTGIRGSVSRVRVQIGGIEAEVLAAQPQGQFMGLDQVNVLVPRELNGRGRVELILTADGKQSNRVILHVE
ncbi:MAG: hypothetical protein ACK5AZ_08695 [Bryobacteraceae bacterium]